jgi:hypothetical protein
VCAQETFFYRLHHVPSSLALSECYAKDMFRAYPHTVPGPSLFAFAEWPSPDARHTLPPHIMALVRSHRLISYTQRMAWPVFAQALASVFFRCCRRLSIAAIPQNLEPAATAVLHAIKRTASSQPPDVSELSVICEAVRSALNSSSAADATSASASASAFASTSSDADTSDEDEVDAALADAQADSDSDTGAPADAKTNAVAAVPNGKLITAACRLSVWCHLLLQALQELVADCDVSLSCAEVLLLHNQRHWYTPPPHAITRIVSPHATSNVCACVCVIWLLQDLYGRRQFLCSRCDRLCFRCRSAGALSCVRRQTHLILHSVKQRSLALRSRM